MEFFRGVNIDWMGKAKYFVALSLTLLAIGAISIIHQGGLRYGIDFRGGTLVYVRFAGPPPIDQLRKGLAGRWTHEQHDATNQRHRQRELEPRCSHRP